MIETTARPAILTTEEVCSTLRQLRKSLYRKIDARDLPAIRLGDGPTAPLRVPGDGLARYRRAHARGCLERLQSVIGFVQVRCRDFVAERATAP